MALLEGFETPATAWDQDTTWQLNLSNTVAEPGDPEVGIVFMAPPSGRVWFIVGGGGRDNTGSNQVLIQPEIYVGTQAVPENLVHDGTGRWFVIPGDTADESIYGSRVSMLTGLTPLAVHYARLVQRVLPGSTSTGDIFVRELLVVPLP